MRRLLRRRQRGQSLVEFALILPIMMFLVLGMVELGFAINHNTTIVTATRQGARVGAELRNGSNKDGGGVTTASQNVDPQIIGAIEGVLISPGSPIDITQITMIEIFKADPSSGAMVGGFDNIWVPAPGHGGPLLPGSSPAQYLDFRPSGGQPWGAETRKGASVADSLGVRITYTYKFITPLGGIVSSFGSGQMTLTDQTIMAVEPPTP
jgi:hypothetical protein